MPFARARSLLGLFAVTLTLSMMAVDYADARRGGSFGSRGVRTFQAPPPTTTAPRPTAPVERTMTPRQGAEQPGAQQPGAQTGALRNPGVQRPGFFQGFGGTMMRGLLLGGLIGMLMGYGFGGIAGFLGLLLQVGLLVLAAVLLMRLFAGRREPQPAYAGAGRGHGPEAAPRDAGFRVPDIGERASREPAGSGAAAPVAAATRAPVAGADEVGITGDDLDTFERLLGEIQDAFGREDFAALRTRTTPEVMSYFAEELGQNAARGERNEVSSVKLLQGDLAESWREDDADWATVALRYESVDVVRDRATGAVVRGDEQPTETTELWTFVRRPGQDWALSAIQEA